MGIIREDVYSCFFDKLVKSGRLKKKRIQRMLVASSQSLLCWINYLDLAIMSHPEIIMGEWVDDQVPKDKGVAEMTGPDTDEIALDKELRMKIMRQKILRVDQDILDTNILIFNKQAKLEKGLHKSMKLSPVAINMLNNNKINRYITITETSRVESSGAVHLENGHSPGDSQFIADVIMSMEIKGSPEELQTLAQMAGKIAAASFRAKNGGLEPTKKDRLVPTYVKGVPGNSIGSFFAYTAQYKSMLEEAVTQAILAREEGAVKTASKRKRDDESQRKKDQQPSVRNLFTRVGVVESA
jgi:hypothetical protein